jgi:3,4-dihydroxy 2-butanone 4-phosphate synthase/GTP cyclohydrolase II
MDPGDHNAAYLAAKRTKLGHLMGEGPTCPVAGPTAVVSWQGASDSAMLAALEERLASWAIEQGLKAEREEEPRVLALLNQPQLAVQLSTGSEHQLGAEALLQALSLLAGEAGTRGVGLILSPDPRGVNHPSVSLEPEQRPLVELRKEHLAQGSGFELVEPRLETGAFLIWQA